MLPVSAHHALRFNMPYGKEREVGPTARSKKYTSVDHHHRMEPPWSSPLIAHIFLALKGLENPGLSTNQNYRPIPPPAHPSHLRPASP
ncbi:hypothetical protein D9756_011043 [Leucocoprinus leucothites]|uniref:Uncharacterized protein n=1 Tax=Leucocoprinus leucothites TaxID=201217 RepID=A0A8H5FQP5_9AGAR|nr:hypothetical protein D9756_011043 [Leucoagaricus leucothites]